MEILRQVTLAAPPAKVFAYVDDLDRYPDWMDLVHAVDAQQTAPGEPPAWEVELRAQVGPFARSKRLRMIRTEHDVANVVTFERAETDGKRHSTWVLRSSLDGTAESTTLVMRLVYGGNLWTGAVLQRVLDDHVERGCSALRSLVATDS